jgi:NAD(P)-dependent dehydrogenase (short-subunit alcohol dehydrogenase family)
MSSKICALVGIGPGLGFAIAKKFGKEGYQMAMLARHSEALKKYKQELKALGIEAYDFKTDAADTESIVTTFEKIRQTLGSPNVLIYNAAALRSGNPMSIAADDLVQDFRVNVAGALTSAQQVVSDMRNSGGTILLTGGGFALDPYPEFTSLAIGKAAIRNLSFSLAKELEKDGIHVATVTICGVIQPGSQFDPDQIAQEYWRLHTQKRAEWERECIYQ